MVVPYIELQLVTALEWHPNRLVCNHEERGLAHTGLAVVSSGLAAACLEYLTADIARVLQGHLRRGYCGVRACREVYNKWCNDEE